MVLLLGPYHMTKAGFEGYGEDWSHADLATFHAFNRVIAAVAKSEGWSPDPTVAVSQSSLS